MYIYIYEYIYNPTNLNWRLFTARPTVRTLTVSAVIKVRLGISRTNADSQWNQLYTVFHRIRCCGNETIRWESCKRDFDVANMRLALVHVCGKQTPSASNLFFSANLVYDLSFKMWRRFRSWSVHNFRTCKRNATALCRLPTNFAAKHVF